MIRLIASMTFSALLLVACTQEGRERLVRDWCESADNCSVYDENGRETRKRDLCHGNPNCSRH